MLQKPCLTVRPPKDWGVYTAVWSVTEGVQVGVFAPPHLCRVAFADGEKDLRRRVVGAGGWELA